jgi:hypothetical protein
MLAWPRAVLLVALVAGCSAESPTEGGETEASGTDSGPDVPADSLLGCAEASCRLLFVAQTLDDRVEIFAPDDPTDQYRGAIDLDLRPGTDAVSLDEPFGIALAPGFLHVVAGHYPVREEGTLLSIPRAFFGAYGIGETVPVGDIVLGMQFQNEIVATPFGVLEPIFLHPEPVLGRLLIGTFNNDLFSIESNWTQPGMVHVVDGADPTQFGAFSLEALEGVASVCAGASQITTLADDTHVAVACDGNEAIAFLNLGEIGTGSPGAAAAAITGTLCELPPLNERRVRYLAYDGNDGVVVGVGPGPGNDRAELWTVRGSDCSNASIEIATGGRSHPGQLVRLASDAWLLASGTPVESDPMRGVYVVTGSGLCEQPIAGFESHWTTPAPNPVEPYALAVTDDGTHVAVGASVSAPFAGTDSAPYGKVLWATLSRTDEGDPCSTTATVVDLTDGADGHAPAPDPTNAKTIRQAPHVLVFGGVQG